MLYLKKKDKKKRFIFKSKDFLSKIIRAFYLHLLSKYSKSKNFFNYRRYLIYKLLKKKKTANKIKIVNRCILTNRSKSVNKIFFISRIKMREYIQLGIIPGFKKSVW